MKDFAAAELLVEGAALVVLGEDDSEVELLEGAADPVGAALLVAVLAGATETSSPPPHAAVMVITPAASTAIAAVRRTIVHPLRHGRPPQPSDGTAGRSPGPQGSTRVVGVRLPGTVRPTGQSGREVLRPVEVMVAEPTTRVPSYSTTD
ncbi:hypothetical protein PZ938_12165 [Luteipulveratus sp. YIM 133132]|nr:hypothetical protein [Luteipulveratus sp. YIM 133132]